MPAAFRNREFEFPQPDGSTIRLRGSGNQFEARFETLDGHPVVRDSNGYFVRAPEAQFESPRLTASTFPSGTTHPERILSRWELRRQQMMRQRRTIAMATETRLAPPAQPTHGAIVGLTVLVEFEDDPATIPESEIERFCNQEGYAAHGNNGSVRDYFYEVSNGKLTYTNIVLPYYRASKPKAYYAEATVAFEERAQELLREALLHHLGQGADFSALSADADGFIRAVNLYYAGTCTNAWCEGLWPHQSTLATRVALPDGRQFADYQMSDMNDHLTLGTFCHENGHMVCDFPDLYRYSGTGTGVGVYCLMCVGGMDRNETNPIEVGAYLKREAGWGTDVPNQAASAITLNAGANEFLVHPKSSQEYFLIENRSANGRDAGLPGSGLAVWYVDETASNTEPAPYYECELLQADGKQDLELGVNEGDAGDLFSSATKAVFDSATNPSSTWRDGQPSGLTLSQIPAAAAAMLFRYG